MTKFTPTSYDGFAQCKDCGETLSAKDAGKHTCPMPSIDITNLEHALRQSAVTRDDNFILSNRNLTDSDYVIDRNKFVDAFTGRPKNLPTQVIVCKHCLGEIPLSDLSTHACLGKRMYDSSSLHAFLGATSPLQHHENDDHIRVVNSGEYLTAPNRWFILEDSPGSPIDYHAVLELVVKLPAADQQKIYEYLNIALGCRMPE